MSTVEILEQALAALRQLGIEPRLELLGSGGGGLCEFAGRKWLFLDLAQTPGEQLHVALTCLRELPLPDRFVLAPQLSHALGLRKSA